MSGYDRTRLKRDLMASLAVAAVSLPQSMAYALVAGVAPKYGLYASIFPALLAALVGSSRTMIVGPTNATSLVVFSVVSGMMRGKVGGPEFVQAVFALTFLQGCFQWLAGTLRLGRAMRFLSEPVLVGFTAGAGILIAVKQVPSLVGLTAWLPHLGSPSPSQPFGDIVETVRAVGAARGSLTLAVDSLLVGAVTLVALLAVRKFFHNSAGHAVSLLLGSLVAYFVGLNVQRVPAVPRMFVELSLPLRMDYSLLREMIGPALALGIFGLVQGVSISKALALKTGEKVDVNREFLALGSANIVGSFFSSLTVSGSFIRSTVNQDAGAQTRMAAVFAALILALSAVTLGPLIGYVPEAALSAILIFAAFHMIDWRRIKLIANATRGDAVAMAVTFVATLTVPLDSAIYLGVIASVAIYLHRTATVEVDPFSSPRGAQIETIRKAARDCPGINILHIEGDLYFGAADDFAEHLARLANTDQRVLILRLRRTRNFDITALSVLEAFVRDQRAKGKHVLLSGVNDVLYGLLKRTGLVDMLGRENVFVANEDDEILRSTRDSVIRAVQIVKEMECSNCTRRGECTLTHMVE